MLFILLLHSIEKTIRQKVAKNTNQIKQPVFTTSVLNYHPMARHGQIYPQAHQEEVLPWVQHPVHVTPAPVHLGPMLQSRVQMGTHSQMGRILVTKPTDL